MLPDGFLAGVSGHRGECGIHVPYVAPGVGDDNAVRSLLYGRKQTGPLDIFTLPAVNGHRMRLTDGSSVLIDLLHELLKLARTQVLRLVQLGSPGPVGGHLLGPPKNGLGLLLR